MWINLSSPQARDAIIDRLLNWHDQAKLAGREARAEQLLALAWFAYDRPLEPPVNIDQVARSPAQVPPADTPEAISQAIFLAFPALADLSIRADSLV